MKNKNKKKNKTIILTGSSGIIGKSLKIFLKKKYLNLILLEGSQKKKNTKNLKEILDLNFVDCLIHLAGKDDYNSSSQEEIIKKNIHLDKQVSQIVKKLKIPHIIFASTNRVYEGSKKSFISEKTKVYPQSVYAKSKLNSEKIFTKLNSKITILRIPSVLSKYSRKGLIYFTIRKMIKNKNIEIYNPSSLFNNVITQEDLNKIIYFIISKEKKLKKKEIININSVNPIKFDKIIKHLLKKINSNSKIIIKKKSLTSKIYSNKYQKKIFNFKVNSVKRSLNYYLNDF